LVRLEHDDRDFAVARAANTPVLGGLEDDLTQRMSDRWGHIDERRGIAPGAAGPVMLSLMTMCGDLYGSVPMSAEGAVHLERVIHAASSAEADRVEQQVELTLTHWRRLRAEAEAATDQ
jgi:hypothetical protein